MKTPVLLRLTLFASGLLAASALTGATIVPDAERTLDGKIDASLRTVRIDHRSGPVTVVGADQDFGWHWVLTCVGDKAEAETFAKECQLDVTDTNGTLQIRFVPPERSRSHSVKTWRVLGFEWTQRRGIEVRSTLELRVPRAVTVSIANRFGSVKAAGIRGPLGVHGQNGSIEISDIGGAVTASTSFGRMSVERTGAAQLTNQNGDIRAVNVNGDMSASTSFAKLHVEAANGRAELKNQNGSVEVADIRGDLRCQTSFGKMEVQDVTGVAELRNQNGSITARRIHRGAHAESSFGTVRVEDIEGDASLKSPNGRIEAARVNGSVVASNSFSSLRVEEIHGDATLDSQNGEVIARAVDGMVRARTSFARMELDGAGKGFEANNQNGPVQITAHSSSLERIAAATSFGPIDVRLPRDCKPLIRANTSFGKVRSDFPVVLTDTFSEAAFNADAASPKITLRGQNSDIRVQLLASQ